MTAPELKAIRQRLGLNQDDFAVLLGGYDPRTIRRWENGERKVPKAVVTMLKDADKKPKRK